MRFVLIHEHYHHQDDEVPAWAAELSRKLDFIIERLRRMATQDQVNKLAADVQALIAAIGAYQEAVTVAIAAAQQASPDPAIDALDATVTAETAKLAASMPAPAPAAAAPGAGT